MKKTFRAAVVAAAVLAVPALSLAAQAKQPAQTAPAASAKTKSDTKSASTKPASATVYSAKGVVKSIDSSTLVLTEKSGKKKRSHDVHFVLDPAVQKDANIAAGSSVRVKYHNDAKKHVATEIREGKGKTA
jgi:hypothetical protein